MQALTYKNLLDAGCHFGHMKRKWNPKMRPFIFMERKGIHIIDLNRTLECLELTAKALKQVAKSGKSVLFVGTKKQARTILEQAAESVNMPFVTDRWLGGMMTNFPTIRRSIRKMQKIEHMLNDGTLDNITKKERLVLARKHAKLNRVFGGIAQLNRLPNALFVADISHEHLAIAEAKKLGIRTFGIVDTNSDPTSIDFVIPANDDASKSIALVTQYITEAIREGLEERKQSSQEQQKEVKSKVQ